MSCILKTGQSLHSPVFYTFNTFIFVVIFLTCRQGLDKRLHLSNLNSRRRSPPATGCVIWVLWYIARKTERSTWKAPLSAGTACVHVRRNGNALFPDGSSGQRAAGCRRRRFGDRTERLLSLRQTMGCGCGSDFRQPSSVLRKGGAGISESSLCRFRGAHVQSRLGSMVHAGSAAGEILSDRTILLLCGESDK